MSLDKYLTNVKEEFFSCLNKWHFLNQRTGLILFPHQKNILNSFDANKKLLNQCIHLIQRDNSTNTIKPLGLYEQIQIYQKLKRVAIFTGFVRTAIIQRTPSHDAIHQTFLPLPSSIERTLGDESILFFADILAQEYYNCLPAKFHGMWEFDGFVTYEPISDQPLCRVEKTLIDEDSKIKGQFHVSMADQYQYTISALSSISHEIAHIALISISDINGHEFVLHPKLDQPLEGFYGLYRSQSKERVSQSFYELSDHCMICPFWEFFRYVENGEYKESDEKQKIDLTPLFPFINQLYIEILADALSFRYGGLSGFDHFVDNIFTVLQLPKEFPPIRNLQLFIRMQNFREYVKWKFNNALNYGPNEELLYNSLIKKIESLHKYLERHYSCVQCPYLLRLELAEYIKKSKRDFIDDFIDVNHEFYNDVYHNNRKDALKTLRHGKLVTDMDPRHLYEVYYILNKYVEPKKSFRTNLILSILKYRNSAEIS